LVESRRELKVQKMYREYGYGHEITAHALRDSRNS